jgi:hypothetical protein
MDTRVVVVMKARDNGRTYRTKTLWYSSGFLFAKAMRIAQLSRHCRALLPLLRVIQQLQPATNLPISVMFQKECIFIFSFYLLSDVNTAIMIRDGVFIIFDCKQLVHTIPGRNRRCGTATEHTQTLGFWITAAITTYSFNTGASAVFTGRTL